MPQGHGPSPQRHGNCWFCLGFVPLVMEVTGGLEVKPRPGGRTIPRTWKHRCGEPGSMELHPKPSKILRYLRSGGVMVHFRSPKQHEYTSKDMNY